MAYPFIGVLGVACLLPPVMYLSMLDTFGYLHPLWPPHLFFIAKKCWTTLQSNNMKVNHCLGLLSWSSNAAS